MKNLASKTRKLMWVMAVVVLAFTSTTFAAGNIAISPTEATLSTSGTNSSVALEAFCSSAVCSLKWYVLPSGPNVGTLQSASGFKNRFQASGQPGTAIVVVQDEEGHMAFAKITVIDPGPR